MSWQQWLYGLASTVINSIASGVVLTIADPTTFNLGDGLTKLLSTAGALGLWAALNFLKQSPLPPLGTDTHAASVQDHPHV